MRPSLGWLTRNGVPVAFAILLAALLYFALDVSRKARDLKRVCDLLGSHDATGRDVGVERRIIDAICLGQETDDDP